MTPEVVRVAVALAFIALLATAAVIDVLHRRIPNWSVVSLLATFGVALAAGVLPAPWWEALAAGAVSLVATYLLYHFNWVGAGDAKLFSAAALFSGLSGLALFGLFTALAGGALALLSIAMNPRRAMRGLIARGRGEDLSRGIPYGAAIALGALAASLFPGGLLQLTLSQ